MGVMSRRVVPACGNLCFFCPSMRARSRQPVKRYKKFLADIFPRHQDAEPNDRKIVKLCDYASKNPLRIPKITDHLEQRCYKDLRHENFGSVKVVLCIYRKFLTLCKDQMPLFASSLIGIARTLLEQTRHDDMQILGCNILVEFISSQTDSTYMFNLEGIIPKLCQLALEGGSNDGAPHLRSAGLQTLASMILFMGEQSHISMEFDKIISVILENYAVDRLYSHSAAQCIHGHNVEDCCSSVSDVNQKVSSFSHLYNNLETTTDVSKNPSYWCRVCLSNMVRLGREATTVRRVFEPLFHHFDTENQWSLEKGLACSVLTFMQSLLDESGDNSHILFSILVKHLDHKSVVKKPQIQIEIINVTTQLAQNAKQQASVTIIGAISDLIKHLRKCLLGSIELPSARHNMDKWNTDLQLALENCILQLSKKVGDAGPILDMLAVVLENIPNSSISARATISAICRTAKTVSSVPNVSYHKKAFPDALFHQLLLAMAHSDHETRVGAHRVFSIVLMPSLQWPRMELKTNTSETVSWLSFVNATQKLNGGSFSFQDEGKRESEPMNGLRGEESLGVDKITDQSLTHPSRRQSSSFSHGFSDGKTELTSLRLSSHQVSLLLSSIWVQATSVDNTPANFEAMAHTYSISLLFTRSKTSSHMALVRCFQLALSLRSISVDQEGGLLPSRRRSLFTLASFMLLFSARAGNLPELIPIIKAHKMVDPYLQLVNDTRLQAVDVEPENDSIRFGSEEDEVTASKFLAILELDEQQLKEAVTSHFMTKYAKLSEAELSSIREQLLRGFLPDEAYPLGAPLFMETPRPCSPLAKLAFPDFDEAMPQAALTDDEAFPEPSGSQSDRRSSLSNSISNFDILSVNQLLESVLETARQVASFPVSSAPIPYDQMKNQCEALVTCKQQKMSVLHSFKHKHEEKAIVLSSEIETIYPPLPVNTMQIIQGDLKYYSKEPNKDYNQLLFCSHEYGRHSLRLPPSSPFDKFLKAAGC